MINGNRFKIIYYLNYLIVDYYCQYTFTRLIKLLVVGI